MVILLNARRRPPTESNNWCGQGNTLYHDFANKTSDAPTMLFRMDECNEHGEEIVLHGDATLWRLKDSLISPVGSLDG